MTSLSHIHGAPQDQMTSPCEQSEGADRSEQPTGQSCNKLEKTDRMPTCAATLLFCSHNKSRELTDNTESIRSCISFCDRSSSSSGNTNLILTIGKLRACLVSLHAITKYLEGSALEAISTEVDLYSSLTIRQNFTGKSF